SIAWGEDEPDRQSLRVRAASDVFLVVADAWFPGWTARLDGRVVPIQRVDLLFRGVPVPAGTHQLTFAYAPEGWALACGVALTGWVIALAIAVAILLEWRRAARAPVRAPA